MVSFIGPDVAQVTSKPVIVIEDSKKFDDGVTLKLAGTNGTSEFEIDDVVTIYAYIKDFLVAKGLSPDLAASANKLLDQSYIPSVGRGESVSAPGNYTSYNN